ncbi:MAG: hypothetical protein R3B48_01805 [Kofleriaceae bacterium]
MIRVLLITAVLLSSSVSAWAQRRVAVAALDGDRGGAVANVVVAALEADFKVIAPKAVTRVADELAVIVSDQEADKLMTELEADVLVTGAVEKADGGHKLTLRVISKGGTKSRAAHVLYGRKANNARVRGGIRTAVTTIVEAQAEQLVDAAEEPIEKPERPVRGKRGKSAKSEKGAKSAGKKPAEDAEDGSRGAPVDDGAAKFKGDARKGSPREDRDAESFRDDRDEDEPDGGRAERRADNDDDDADDDEPDAGARRSRKAKAKGEGRAPVAARVSVGPSVSNRTLEFSHRPFAEAPADYKGGVVPGARVQGEVYPMAFVGGGVLANFGVGFTFDQTLGLKVKSGGMELATTMRNYSVDARVRVPLGSVQLQVVGGYARRTFKVARGGAALDLPDIDYKMFNPGLGFLVPFGRLAIFGEARALLITSAGPIEKPASYGTATISAFDAEAGLEIGVTRSVAVRLSGRFVGFGYDFKGNGEMSNNRDMDSTSVDVGGAAERYIGGALTASMTY